MSKSGRHGCLIWRAVGRVPMRWYKDEEHIGYSRDAEKIMRSAQKDKLDALLARADAGGRALRTIYDEYNDEEIVLSKEELRLIQRIREGRFPHVEVRARHCRLRYYLPRLGQIFVHCTNAQGVSPHLSKCARTVPPLKGLGNL